MFRSSTQASGARHPRRSRAPQRAFTLVEIITTITIIGLIASVALSSFGRITERSRDAVASNLVDTLNKATRNFSYANWDLRYQASPDSAADELLVLRSLQWREKDGTVGQKELAYKGPYMRPDWNPATSNSDDDWRIHWTGSSWGLLEKGETGTGLKVDFDGADLGTPVVLPPNFSPVGNN